MIKFVASCRIYFQKAWITFGCFFVQLFVLLLFVNAHGKKRRISVMLGSSSFEVWLAGWLAGLLVCWLVMVKGGFGCKKH